MRATARWLILYLLKTAGEFLLSGIRRLLAEMPIQHLLGELDALKFHQLSILLHMPVQGHADLPRTGKCLGILQSGLIHQSISAARRITLGHVQSVAVMI